MPASRSVKPDIKKRAAPERAAPQRPNFLRPLALIVALAVAAVVVIALPASLVSRALPPSVHAEDFSGSLWHGSAGNLLVNSRPAGAIEWHLHPMSLLRLTLAADLHWVKVGFVADGAVEVDRHGLTAQGVAGGGPIEDLQDLGVAAGWHGSGSFKFSELKIGFVGASIVPLSVVGDVAVSNLASSQFAAGTDLGGYSLVFADGAITPDTDTTAELTDTGGPLEVKAVIHYVAKERTGMLSGTIKERADASEALRSQLGNLAQLHARDAQGRLPVDLEFTL
jgi:hypothetical protein